MADRKISDLTALTAPASGDYLPIVDISEVAAASKNKRITIEELFRGIPLGTAAAPSIAIEGDEDTGIYSPGANQLAVATNGTGRLFVADNRFRLNVGSQFQITDTLDTNGLQLFGSTAGDCVVGTLANQALVFRSNGSERLRIAGGGRVQLPTTSQLQITDNADVTGLQFLGSSSAASLIGTMGAHDLYFRTNSTERLRITSAGLVGIGTSSPRSQLNVSSNGATTLTLENSGTTLLENSVFGQIDFYANDTSLNGTGAKCNIKAFTENATGNIAALTFSTSSSNSATGVERLRITGAGLVGIGTTSPQANLEVSATEASITVGATAPTASGIAGSGWFRMRDNTNSYDVAAIRGLSTTPGNTGSLIFYTAAGGALTERARLLSEGYFRFDAPSGQPGAVFRINSSEVSRIDSSGRLLVATSSARVIPFATPTFQVVGTGYSVANILAWGNSNDTNGGFITLGKSRGTSNEIVSSGDVLGGFEFLGSDGTQAVPAARFRCEVDGTPGVNDMPGRLVFSTTADGSNNPTERLRIDSSGRLLVGTSSARSNVFTITPRIQYEGTGASENRFVSIGYNNNDASGSGIALFKTRGTAVGSNTSVADNDDLGQIRFCGADGTNVIQGALIRAEVDGTPGANDMPGRLVFSTTADGSSSPTERMRISNDGAVKVAGDNFQIATSKTPASATAAGTAGQIAWDANYIYVCTATNTWKRSAIATW